MNVDIEFLTSADAYADVAIIYCVRADADADISLYYY